MYDIVLNILFIMLLWSVVLCVFCLLNIHCLGIFFSL